MNVESCLVFGDLVDCEISLEPHGPYKWNDINAFRNLVMLDQLPSLGLDMPIHFLHNSICKSLGVWLTHCLVIVHDVAHHFSMKSNRVAHPVLELQVVVMKFLIRHGNTDVGHVVHVGLAIKNTL